MAAPSASPTTSPDTTVSVPKIGSSAVDRALKSKYPAGKYIVTLKDDPAATYGGGISGYAATKPAAGRQLNAKATEVSRYTKLLGDKQKSLETQVGVKALYNYTLAYNGFAANLTSVEAARLAKSDAVASVVPNKLLKIQEAQSSIDYLKISTPGGVWDSIGGVQNAGKGVVVGDLDTGIAPENPSFAGDPLGTAASTTKPWLDGNVIHFAKNDGTTFSSTRQTGVGFDNDDYSTKIIGAHYYVDGFGASQIGGAAQGEYLSPRDGDSHGSHTASTAAGNAGVKATVSGNDFGTIAGVAPAAKIAAYKVCWSGKDLDPNVTTDDGCATTDIVAAIDQSVKDGVDVINFSIGGGAASSVYSPSDQAFLNAASAGIFVSASAGNSGPASSTLDNASPWITTVAATTIPSYEATAVLGNGAKYAGASITVHSELTAPLVLASSIPATGATADDANLCLAGTIDPAQAAGKIVVCERGNNGRLEKSAAVKAAGGVGMILLNVDAGDTITDDHTIPSIHIDAPYREAIRAYAATPGATATLVPGNTTGKVTPVPQLAGFSSRGPVQAAGSDVLKPDISAPGVSILAAGANAPGEAPTYEFLSGTSMAAPHVTGLGALYLGVHPLATPAEIQSALMTTASDTVDNDNVPTLDPFGQGAGEVKPTAYLNPGLLYLATPADWKRYLVGTGEATFPGVTAIDPSDLNLASIAIGDLSGTQKITRTVTSQGAGTYKGSVSVAGLKVKLSPSTLKFTAAGQTKKFTVTFTRTTAPLDEYATGFLTWKKTSGKSTTAATVRSPIAIHPTRVKVPAVVNGEGTSGSVTVPVLPGVDGKIKVTPAGLAQGNVTPNATDASLPYTDKLATGENGQYVHQVLPGTSFARFDVQPIEDNPATDLDLYVFYAATENDTPKVIAQSATGDAGETVDLVDPEPGIYITFVDVFSAPVGGAAFTDKAYLLNPATDVGNLTAVPSVIKGKTGVATSYVLRWGGLDPYSSFLGFVHYSGSDVVTDVYVDTAEALPPVALTKPTVNGAAEVGKVVTAKPGTWDADTKALTISYQWLLDGEAIAGATGTSYRIPALAVGHALSVLVTAKVGTGPATLVSSAAVTVVASSTTSFTLDRSTITSRDRAVVTVKVTTLPVGNAIGKVTVKYGSKTVTLRLTATSKGTVKVALPKLSPKKYAITAFFEGSDVAGPSISAAKTLTVKK